ncbi:hypothetical protein RMATCC62417_06928 [Rhizopus microsporus]|nr:hypothetical protein RMATCC62417_06928 [Rhizopus microsporus]CEI92578.1 hypothetical protein RMCBS344292_06833 [Rhizopus microsporus]
MDYHPSHKASSVSSTGSSSSSLWESVPSLYTGKADSVSSAFDDLLLPEPDEDALEKQQKELAIQEEENHEMIDNNSVTLAKKRHRDLLSDDQKRANHIASEQKRRNMIRSGFRELTELIPTLKNINNSKSTILFKSVDYIKQLEKRNKILKERLLLLQQKLKQKQLKKALKQQQLQQQQQQQQHPMTYNSISIPSDTVNTMPALVMPASVDDWLLNQFNQPYLNIPNNDDNVLTIQSGRESLLSSGKLNHLK